MRHRDVRSSIAAQLVQRSSDFARMRRVIRIGLFITFCWVLSGNTAGAQQSSAATLKPSPTNPVPTPIPLSEIASQAQSATESLRDIEASLSADQITTTVEKRLPPEIPRRVQSLIDSIGRTRQAVESRRAKVVALQGRVLESTARVQTASSALEQAQAKAVPIVYLCLSTRPLPTERSQEMLVQDFGLTKFCPRFIGVLVLVCAFAPVPEASGGGLDAA